MNLANTDPALLRRLEGFLYDEAELLDSWQLQQWEALFTEEGRYYIPPLNIANPETAESGSLLFLAHDDRRMIAGRVERLMKKTAYVENPRSNVLHLLSNIRILADDGVILRSRCNFIVYRARRGQTTQYIGRYFHTLHHHQGGFRIEEKRVCLSNDLLQPQGSIGIIL